VVDAYNGAVGRASAGNSEARSGSEASGAETGSTGGDKA